MIWTGESVKAYRESLGMGPYEFAQALGIAYQNIWRWEHGKNAVQKNLALRLDAYKRRRETLGDEYVCTCPCPIHTKPAQVDRAPWSEAERRVLVQVIDARGTVEDARRLLLDRCGTVRSRVAIYRQARRWDLSFFHREWLTTGEVGKRLGMPRDTVRRLILQGKLSGRRHYSDGRPRKSDYWFEVHEEEVERYRREHQGGTA